MIVSVIHHIQQLLLETEMETCRKAKTCDMRLVFVLLFNIHSLYDGFYY